MASEKILQSKQQYVDELAAKLEKAAGGVIVDYRGITVSADTVLRKELREAGVEYFVVKNTLLKRAAEKAGITGIDEHLRGTTAIAISEDDIIAAPKILFKQVEASKGTLRYQGWFHRKGSNSYFCCGRIRKASQQGNTCFQASLHASVSYARLAIAASEIAKKQENEEVA